MNKIKKPHEISVKTFLKCLIYGQPGIGKSTFALSSPNPVLLDFDNGVHRIKYEHQTDTLQIESWQDILQVLSDGSLNSYNTIVIDTAGKMLDYLSDYIIKNNPKMGRTNGALSLQGYGERKGEFLNFLRKVSIMGKHLLFVAHEKEEKEGDTSHKRPEVGGSSGTDLYKELDVIGYMEAIGRKRTISFMPTEKYYAKNACGLNDVIELPELGEGMPNDFFTKNILGVYEATLADRKEKIEAYNELIDLIEGKIESVTDAETANEFIGWATSFEDHLADSKLQASFRLKEKTKQLGLTWDVKKKVFTEKQKDAATI